VRHGRVCTDTKMPARPSKNEGENLPSFSCPGRFGTVRTMGGPVTIIFESSTVELGTGESISFGRAPGRSQIYRGQDKSVSDVHGLVTCTETNWSVTAKGSRYSFVVADVHTPSSIVVPLHAGPIAIPFAEALILIQANWNHSFQVYAHGAPGWVTEKSTPTQANSPNRTALAERHRGMKTHTADGRPLRWFQVLVAICEPRLKDPFYSQCPTRNQVIGRLGISGTRLDEDYVPEIRKRLGIPSTITGFDHFATHASIIAIAQRFVAREDLRLTQSPWHD
jgi:hypothetical protein